MYIADKKLRPEKKRFKKTRRIILSLILAGVIFGIWWLLTRQELVKQESSATSRSITFKDNLKDFEAKGYFTLKLPPDWKPTKVKQGRDIRFSWTGTARDSIGRSLDVYIDSVPGLFAVNRIAPVISAGDHFDIGAISPNCVNFTGNLAKLTPFQAAQRAVVSTKWDGVAFTCDVPNELRNVVATSSKEGAFKVTLTGKKSGSHHYLIVYTDHASAQDENLFPKVLQSFKAE